MARLETEEREGDADLVVERGRGLEHAVAGAERGRDGFLRGRLSDVAGDADRGDRIPVAEPFGNGPQGGERRIDLHEHTALAGTVHGMFDDRGARAPRERVGHERMTVTLTLEREEQLAGAHEARVECAAAEAQIRHGCSVDDPSARRIEEIVEREHHRMVPSDQGRSGCRRRSRSVSCAMLRNAVMAVTVPRSFDCGRSSTMTATKRGSFAGANPANDEMYASSRYRPSSLGICAVPVFPAMLKCGIVAPLAMPLSTLEMSIVRSVAAVSALIGRRTATGAVRCSPSASRRVATTYGLYSVPPFAIAAYA